MTDRTKEQLLKEVKKINLQRLKELTLKRKNKTWNKEEIHEYYCLKDKYKYSTK
jgi:hypothetical protein